MRPAPAFNRLLSASHDLPRPFRWAFTVLLVGGSFGLVLALQQTTGMPAPFLGFLPAVIAAATLFDRGSSYIAIVLSAVAVGIGLLPWPIGSGDWLAIAMFTAVGALVAAIVGVLHRTTVALEASTTALRGAEHRRSLLLREFQHRSRNDLQSLAALLLLRARSAPSAAAADALREGAGHAVALARVQSWLAPKSTGPDDPGTVDTRLFLEGLVGDLRLHRADPLRPVSLDVRAEAHALDTERALQLGLVVIELVANAHRYAFPDDRAGMVGVEFRREADNFELIVQDDGIGLEAGADLSRTSPAPGLGSRLLTGFASQLRGSLRRSSADGNGTRAILRFPVASPAG